jgi:hypothetical protein
MRQGVSSRHAIRAPASSSSSSLRRTIGLPHTGQPRAAPRTEGAACILRVHASLISMTPPRPPNGGLSEDHLAFGFERRPSVA